MKKVKVISSDSNRRQKGSASDQELYGLSKSDIKKFIKDERRHDELSRLREIQKQKHVWKKTLIACGLLNLTFIGLGLLGYMIK